jgi:hypothetical protein
MTRSLIIILLSLLTLSLQLVPAQTQKDKKAFTGSWLGSIEINSIRLRLVFNIKLNEKDSLTATMDSPDQNAKNIPMGRVITKADSLIILAPLLMGHYKGTMVNDTTILGQWTQRGQAMKIDLSKLKGSFALKRPQDPKKLQFRTGNSILTLQEHLPYLREMVLFLLL